MRILRAQVLSYKSLKDSGEFSLAPGLNVLVGRNNAGKSATIEALSMRFKNAPTRSRSTLHSRGGPPPRGSYVTLKIQLDPGETMTRLSETYQRIQIGINEDGNFLERLNNRIIAGLQVESMLSN